MSTLPEMRMTGVRPFPPRVSAFTRPFWDALEAGTLRSTRCDDCALLGFPPRNLCRACWSRRVSWTDLASGGVLYSFTRVHVAPTAFRADAPYAIGLVDLDDGVRLMCRMVGAVEAADIGGRIGLLVLRYEDGALFGARMTHSRSTSRSDLHPEPWSPS
jgi:uncharacterized OB-fold protein